MIFIGVRNDIDAEPAFPMPLPYRYSVRDALPEMTHYKIVTGNGPRDECTPDISSPTIMATDGARSSSTLSGSTLGRISVDGERRKFTIAELRRICAFPDDFKLTGSYAQQWARLGLAVPPVMMRHIAETIRDEILTENK